MTESDLAGLCLTLQKIIQQKQTKMRRLFLFAFLFLSLCLSAQDRRPVDARHPLWMIHVDVWNNADPQKIIDLIPSDIKPFVCMNLSMSCAYDKELDMYKKPQSAIETYKSWASICCANDMWFTCQPASGGHTHIMDDDLDTFEYFFKEYRNFLGWNYAEQFWGFNEAGDKSSSKDTDRIALFARLVPMHHQYGGFLTISFCGNIWSHPLNPIGMMKRNPDFLSACRQNPEAILFLYKYTTSASWFNNESVALAPFISGLAKNYGIRYDNCGWNGAIDELCKNDGLTHTYPGAVGIAPVLEQMCLNGACVWDGPELIWTEDFRETGRTVVDGYTRRNWTTYPNFGNIWVDMFRKVLDGTIHIATREEVIGRTKIAMVNDIQVQDDPTSLKIHAYAAPVDLYHGLYLQDDPFNARTSFESGFGTINGYGNNNMLYFKKTGRYQAIPIVIDMYDDLARSIPMQVKRSAYNAKSGNWSSRDSKVATFNRLYPEVSKGDLFVARHHNELVCYTPYSYLNTKRNAQAEIPLKYNTCESLALDFQLFSSAVVKEYSEHLVLYLNNYRSDTTKMVTDKITITGATTRPACSFITRAQATGSMTGEWNEQTHTYVCRVTHNGPIDLVIRCKGSAADRQTDYLDDTPLTDLPKQPSPGLKDIIIEAEDMDYRNVSNVVTDAYNSGYRNLRGHAGMGFVVMGTSTSGSLQCYPKTRAGGTYLVTLKYMLNGTTRTSLQARMNAASTRFSLQPTSGTWMTTTFEAVMEEGRNTFTLTNTGGKDLMIDQVCFSPGPDVVDPLSRITLADGSAYGNTQEQHVSELTYTRNFRNTQWQPLYVPFSMQYEDWAGEGLEVARINGFYEYDDNEDGITDRSSLEVLKVRSGRLLPNHPYLIRSSQTGEKSIVLKNCVLSPAEENSIDCRTVETEYFFSGTYRKVELEELTASSCYVMSNGKLVPSASALNPMRWYMNRVSRNGQLLPELTEIKVFSVGEDDADALEIASEDASASQLFDLTGRRTEGRTKGLYIRHGRKLLVR